MGFGGGGGGGSRDLEDVERSLIQQQTLEARNSGGREGILFERLGNLSLGANSLVPGAQESASRFATNIEGQAGQLQDEGIRRRQLEEQILGGAQGAALNVGNLGQQFRGTSTQGAQNIAGLGGQFTGGFGTAQAQGQDQILLEAFRSGRLGNQTAQELDPIRQQTLGLTGQALQGNIAPEIQQLFANASSGERDILEQQFNVARNRVAEGAAGRGGNLNSNLASLEGQRALALGRLENQNTNAQRQLAGQLFGTGIDQGFSANQQVAGFGNQAGQLFGLAGGQGLAAEGQRQSALGQQLSSLDTALGRDLQGIAGQQQSEIQRQQLLQSLASQLGGGADQLRLSSPGLLGQSFGLQQGAIQLPSIPASISSGAQITPASAFLGPAQQSVSQSLAASQQAEAQKAAGQAQLLGSSISSAASLASLAILT